MNAVLLKQDTTKKSKLNKTTFYKMNTRSMRPSGDLLCSYAVWLATQSAFPLPWVSRKLGLALYFNSSDIAYNTEQLLLTKIRVRMSVEKNV